MKKYKNFILNLSLKKIYSHFFLNDFKKNSYYKHLKDLYFEFLLSKYPKYNKDDYEKKLNKLIIERGNYGDLLGPLNDLFEPDYADDLQNYYKLFEKQNFFRFLTYSINSKLIKNNYSEIYSFAIDKTNEPLNILEIGGGVPHGLIFNIWKKGKSFCNNLTYIEADLLHSEFVKWYCKRNNIKLDIRFFPAAKTPTIKNINYNFVFAKDIFEHLDEPEKLIDELVSFTKNKNSLLCLDLEHKGEKNVQHISPNLPILKTKLLDAGFKVIKKFGEVHVWQKN
jgi:hypothetical protein